MAPIPTTIPTTTELQYLALLVAEQILEEEGVPPTARARVAQAHTALLRAGRREWGNIFVQGGDHDPH